MQMRADVMGKILLINANTIQHDFNSSFQAQIPMQDNDLATYNEVYFFHEGGADDINKGTEEVQRLRVNGVFSGIKEKIKGIFSLDEIKEIMENKKQDEIMLLSSNDIKIENVKIERIKIFKKMSDRMVEIDSAMLNLLETPPPPFLIQI